MGKPPPPGSFDEELFPALRGETVEPRFAIVFRLAILGNNESLFQEPLQSWVERSMADLEHIVGPLFDGLRDRVPVRTAEGERLQNQQIERALQKIQMVVKSSSRHSTTE
jgi:hypothetical protein